jgi:outer membrane protein assembly factor BamD
LLSLALLASFGACSTAPINESDPESMYKDAEADIESDRYQIAVEKLQLVKNKFPYSRFSALAQLRLGDVYFLQDQFLEAATAYELFRDLHPRHERIPYAMYRVGESYLNDIPGNIQRDIASARSAEVAFQQFIARFPTDAQAAEAKNQLQRARNIQAEKEYLIGEFYFRRSKWKAASGRFEHITRDYPDTPSFKDAQERLARANSEIQKTK